MIQLALAFMDKDGSYAEHAGVVLASVFRNTSSAITVHILHDDTLNEKNKQKLHELTTRFNQKINFHHITLPAEMLEAIAGIKNINIWTMACMYRLMLPIVIPADRVIYLDCDVLVNMDIAELWEINLEHHYLAAAKDPDIMKAVDNLIDCGLNPDIYFNSGVILFELNNIRQKHGWFEEIVSFLRNFPQTTMPDQDALNAVFAGNYLQIDQRFNSFITGKEHDFNHKICHFAGDDKCWDARSSGAALYRDYLKLTPWKKHKKRGKHICAYCLKRKLRKPSSGKPSVVRKSYWKITGKKRIRTVTSKQRSVKKSRRSRVLIIKTKKRIRRCGVRC